MRDLVWAKNLHRKRWQRIVPPPCQRSPFAHRAGFIRLLTPEVGYFSWWSSQMIAVPTIGRLASIEALVLMGRLFSKPSSSTISNLPFVKATS